MHCSTCDNFIALDENVYFIVYQVLCLLQEEKVLYGFILLACFSFEAIELWVPGTRDVGEDHAWTLVMQQRVT